MQLREGMEHGACGWLRTFSRHWKSLIYPLWTTGKVPPKIQHVVVMICSFWRGVRRRRESEERKPHFLAANQRISLHLADLNIDTRTTGSKQGQEKFPMEMSPVFLTSRWSLIWVKNKLRYLFLYGKICVTWLVVITEKWIWWSKKILSLFISSHGLILRKRRIWEKNPPISFLFQIGMKWKRGHS